MGYKVAIAGATGNVGREMLNILAERQFPVDEIAALASRRSLGTEVSFGDKTLKTQDLDTFDFTGWDIALFAIGSDATKTYAPKAAAAGCVVIDNSSLYRYDPDVPLVVPECNPEAVDGYAKKNIIANPNCSTAQMVVALKPLHDRARIKRVVVSTYQSVSGAGKDGMDELWEQTKAVYNPTSDVPPAKFQKEIAFNVIPYRRLHGRRFDQGRMENGGGNQEDHRPVDKGHGHLRARAGLRGPFRGHQHRVRRVPRRGRGPRYPARVAGHHGDRQARVGWLRHAQGMRGGLRHLHQPHPSGLDDRQWPEPVVCLRQPAQGRGPERGSDRRNSWQPCPEKGLTPVCGK